jgi:hypothetical protein
VEQPTWLLSGASCRRLLSTLQAHFGDEALRKPGGLVARQDGQVARSTRFVPKGQSRIAQRFIAGSRRAGQQVPKGRPKSDAEIQFSFVPPGLDGFESENPALKRRAIFTLSLRDRGVEFPNGIRLQPTFRFKSGISFPTNY